MTDLLALLALAVIAAALYWNAIDGEFFLDDGLILNAVRYSMPGMPVHPRDRSLRGRWGRWKERRPVFITYERDARIHGKKTRGWHLTNLAIHAACVALGFGLLRMWFGIPASFIGALIWSSSPTAASAVNYISARPTLLCSAFYLGGLLAVALGLWWPCLPFAYLAWKCKEEAAMWPLAALIVWRLG